MLRVETSFRDTPGDDWYFVLLYEGRPLAEQLDALGLRDGDKILLWEPDCDFEVEATLHFNYKHSMMYEAALWARVP